MSKFTMEPGKDVPEIDGIPINRKPEGTGYGYEVDVKVMKEDKLNDVYHSSSRTHMSEVIYPQEAEVMMRRPGAKDGSRRK